MTMARAFCAFAHLALIAALAGCAAEATREHGGEADGAHDPVMTAAIEGQLLVDPDLSQSNMRNLAVMPAGPADPALPLPDPPGK